MIAVVDAGIGNLRSVYKAVAAVAGAEVELVSDAAKLRGADRLVVPGQGAFGDSARALRPDAPLGAAVIDHVRAGKPYLGICLGLQLLFEHSEEAPGQPGLGLLSGAVRKLPAASDGDRPCKLPNIGWSDTRAAHDRDAVDRALQGWFYFVHSYAAVGTVETDTAARAQFGEHTFTAAVRRDNVIGVQFHPEKSQAAGLKLLDAFCRWRA
jgi:glutamine amidotransferase